MIQQYFSLLIFGRFEKLKFSISISTFTNNEFNETIEMLEGNGVIYVDGNLLIVGSPVQVARFKHKCIQRSSSSLPAPHPQLP